MHVQTRPLNGLQCLTRWESLLPADGILASASSPVRLDLDAAVEIEIASPKNKSSVVEGVPPLPPSNWCQMASNLRKPCRMLNSEDQQCERSAAQPQTAAPCAGREQGRLTNSAPGTNRDSTSWFRIGASMSKAARTTNYCLHRAAGGSWSVGIPTMWR